MKTATLVTGIIGIAAGNFAFEAMHSRDWEKAFGATLYGWIVLGTAFAIESLPSA